MKKTNKRVDYAPPEVMPQMHDAVVDVFEQARYGVYVLMCCPSVGIIYNYHDYQVSIIHLSPMGTGVCDHM